ncbi:MAG: lipocalin-like domain-containing protein, partial [Patescibacteria group bacterium]
ALRVRPSRGGTEREGGRVSTPNLFPSDWPVPGPIDLSTHDLPHASATTEWWYVNAHLIAADGRALSLFAAFFRIVDGKRPDGSPEYAHSLTWALSDVAKGEYLARNGVTQLATEVAKKYPMSVLFAGQLVFPKETIFSGILHNYTSFAIQNQLYYQGIPVLVLPVRVEDTQKA